jgi:hypothetical protein
LNVEPIFVVLDKCAVLVDQARLGIAKNNVRPAVEYFEAAFD